MASYSVRSAKHATLLVSTVDTVIMTDRFPYVRVTNRGALGDLFFTIDGTAPVALADDAYTVPQTTSLIRSVPDPTAIIVKLIATAAVPYSVEGSSVF